MLPSYLIHHILFPLQLTPYFQINMPINHVWAGVKETEYFGRIIIKRNEVCLFYLLHHVFIKNIFIFDWTSLTYLEKYSF
jgi:hypothetical protein